jgi:hypothetical protein
MVRAANTPQKAWVAELWLFLTRLYTWFSQKLLFLHIQDANQQRPCKSTSLYRSPHTHMTVLPYTVDSKTVSEGTSFHLPALQYLTPSDMTRGSDRDA